MGYAVDMPGLANTRPILTLEETALGRTRIWKIAFLERHGKISR